MSRGKKRLGSGGNANPSSLSAREIGSAVLPGALDEHLDDLRRRVRAEPLGQLIVGHHVHRLGDQEVARVGLLQNFGEQIADLVHAGEAPEDGDELPVLALGDLEIDDVVVEVVFAVAGRDRFELVPGRVHQHGLERADFGGDVDSHR